MNKVINLLYVKGGVNIGRYKVLYNQSNNNIQTQMKTILEDHPEYRFVDLQYHTSICQDTVEASLIVEIRENIYYENRKNKLEKNLDKLIKENEELTKKLKNVNKKEVKLIIETYGTGGTEIDRKTTSIMVNDEAHNKIYLHIGQHTYRIDKNGKILSKLN